MYLLTILSVALAAAASAAPANSSESTATPSPSPAPYNGTVRAVPDGMEYYWRNLDTMKRRDDKKDEAAGVYVCSGPGFKNDCIWQQVVDMTCMALPETTTLAFGPDKGIQCRLYAGAQCESDDDGPMRSSGETTFPGVTDFRPPYETLKSYPRSYRCKHCSAGKACGITDYADYWVYQPCDYGSLACGIHGS